MKNHFFAFFFCFSVLSFAQTGGTSFAVLNQNFDARSIALGGNAMLAWDAGVGKALWNPALLNKEMYNRFSYDHTTYPASIQLNQLSYSRWNSKLEIQQSYSIQQASYGDMKRTLENGVVEGEFTPRDLIFQAGASKKLNELLQIGVQPKFIFSDLGDYSSTGFYMDFSGVYTSKNERVLASVLVRNAGFVLSKFSENTTYASPLEIQMSVSNRFEHMPLRWMISLEQIQDPILNYENDPKFININSLENETTIETPSFTNKVMRHISVGAELLFSEHFHFNFGYDFGRRQELSVKDFEKTTGISWGFAMKISKFNLRYARSAYHPSGPISSIHLSFNLNDFKKKRTI